MGMDIYGKEPRSEKGSYIRFSIWSWSPLWDYVRYVAPWTREQVIYAYSNDADGLDDKDSVKLAHLLGREIVTGRTAMYQKGYEITQAGLPDEPCDLCATTGIRADAIGVEMGMPNKRIETPGHPREGEQGWCNGCNGRGWRRPVGTHCPFTVENVEEFAEFLMDCGGFQIR